MKKILLIEDDENIIKALEFALEEEGYEVVSTGTGQSGLEMARLLKPDIILLDLMLPDMNGIEVCRSLKSDKEHKSIPIIIITALGDTENTVKCLSAGANDYVSKPFNLTELMARVVSHLKMKELYDTVKIEKEEKSVLLNVSQSLSAAVDPYETLYIIVTKLAEVIKVKRCSIIYVTPAGKKGIVMASHDSKNIKHLEIDLNKYPEIQRVLETGETVVINDVLNDPILFSVKERLKMIDIKSIMAYPITFKDTLIGTLILRTSRIEAPFSERETKFCGLISHIAASPLKTAYALEILHLEKEAERKQRFAAEAKSEELRELLEVTTEASPAPLCVIDREGIITDVNSAYLAEWTPGLAKEKVVGENLFKKSGNGPHLDFYKKILHGKKIKVELETKPDNGGDKRTYIFQGAPLFDSQKELVGGIFSTSDITDWKLAEERASRQSAVLEAINRVFEEALKCETEEKVAGTCLAVAAELTGSKFGFIGEVNKDGLFDTTAISNPGWDACKMPDTEALKLTVNMPIRGIDRSTIREEKSRIVNDPASHPDWIGTPEGHPPITAFLGVPLKHAGKTIGMISLANKEQGYTAADVENIEALGIAFIETLMRKRAEIALQKANDHLENMVQSRTSDLVAANDALRKLKNAIEQTVEMILITDPDGAIEYVNPAFERITGYTSTEILRQNPRFLKSEKQDVHFYKLMWDTINSGQVWRGRLENKKKSGETYYEEMTISPIKDKDGRILNFVAIKRDITEEHKWQEQLNQAEKLVTIGRLTAGVAHEILNPLHIISGRMQILGMKEDTIPEIKKICGKVEEQVARVVTIANDLLSFARQKKPEKEKVRVEEIIEKVLSLSNYEVQSAGLFIRKDFAPHIPQVMADKNQLQQVFVNLFQNALDAIAERKKEERGKESMEMGIQIGISYLSDDGMLKIEFKDTGCGIPEDMAGKVFDPFFTTKEPGKGTGLGLSISYGIIQNHEGTFNLAANEYGGTTAVIRLKAV